MISATKHARVQNPQTVQARGGRLQSVRIPHGRRKPHRQLNHDGMSNLPWLAPKIESIPDTHEQERVIIRATRSWHHDCQVPTLALPELAVTPELQKTIEGRYFEQVTPDLSLLPLQPEIQLPLWLSLPQPLEQPGDQDKRTFACPYHKWNPGKYQACQRYILSRFKDVIQHIRRRHVVSLFCTRCHARFESLSSLEAHERNVTPCPARFRAGIVSRYHLDRFVETREHDSSKGKSAEDQWIELWYFLFPEVGSPPSVYVETREEEMSSHLYSFWFYNHHDITSQVTQHCQITLGSQPGNSAQVFDLFLRQLLEHFQKLGGKSLTNPPGTAMEITAQPPASGLENVQIENRYISTPDKPAPGETTSIGEQHSQLPFIGSYSTSSDGTDAIDHENWLCSTFVGPNNPLFEPLRTPDPSLSVDANVTLLSKGNPPTTSAYTPPDFIDLTDSD